MLRPNTWSALEEYTHMPPASKEDFNQYFEELVSEYQPENPVENTTLGLIALADYRMHRLERMESAIIDSGRVANRDGIAALDAIAEFQVLIIRHRNRWIERMHRIRRNRGLSLWR